MTMKTRHRNSKIVLLSDFHIVDYNSHTACVFFVCTSVRLEKQNLTKIREMSERKKRIT